MSFEVVSEMIQIYIKKLTGVFLILDIDDTKSIRKEISYARDLIKSYDFKRIASKRNKIRNMLNHKLASYPRATKDDVYVRIIKQNKMNTDMIGHCGAYDCMH